MTICDICTGFHPMMACPTAKQHVHDCLTAPRVDDFQPSPIGVVIPFPALSDQQRRAMKHYHRQARDFEGIRATRLA